MQNPSQGVAQQLQPHVHLISAHKFAHSASLDIQSAYRYLLDAPTIVKQIAPMSWQYVSAPADGTVWLEWVPPEKADNFASDGYVWGDPEQSFRHETQNYTMEMRVHRFGFRPGQDSIANHARTRYHFISKNPAVHAPPPDPALWIVHYHHSDQLIPSQQVHVTTQIQHVIAQRRWIESQGTLARRDFMLHDREHWPMITVPGPMQQQGQYGGAAAMQNRYPQQHYPQQPGQPPVAKKPRTSGPSMAAPGSSDGPQENSIEVEEDTALGDFFDHLTQRDISLARYMQHHRWMEEVFSSPYASSQIIPPDLGLGLMGELKGLTDGILEPPNLEIREPAEKTSKAKDTEAFTSLKKEQVEEFGKRVAKHLEEGQAEIERMKADHAAKMQDWKKVKTLMQAEKRLRHATWEGHDDAVPAYRLEAPAANGHVEVPAKQEKVDDVIKEVEDLLKVKVTSHEDATQIARGGLKDRKPQTFDYDQQTNQQDTTMEGMHTDQPTTTEPTTYHEDPLAATRTAEGQSSTNAPQSAFGASTGVQVGASGIDADQAAGDDGTGNLGLPGVDMDDTLMEGMEMDMDEHINFDDDDDGPGLDDDAGTTELPTSGAASTEAITKATLPQDSSATPGQNPGDSQVGGPDQAPGDFGDDALGGDSGDGGMFNDNTFADLTNIDGNDGLDDFGGDGMGLDDSAFGDALHGMEDAGEGSGEGGTPATGS